MEKIRKEVFGDEKFKVLSLSVGGGIKITIHWASAFKADSPAHAPIGVKWFKDMEPMSTGPDSHTCILPCILRAARPVYLVRA